MACPGKFRSQHTKGKLARNSKLVVLLENRQERQQFRAFLSFRPGLQRLSSLKFWKPHCSLPPQIVSCSFSPRRLDQTELDRGRTDTRVLSYLFIHQSPDLRFLLRQDLTAVFSKRKRQRLFTWAYRCPTGNRKQNRVRPLFCISLFITLKLWVRPLLSSVF